MFVLRSKTPSIFFHDDAFDVPEDSVLEIECRLEGLELVHHGLFLAGVWKGRTETGSSYTAFLVVLNMAGLYETAIS